MNEIFYVSHKIPDLFSTEGMLKTNNFVKISNMLKVGVLGAGHLGKIHLRQILELKDIYELVGFYDPDPITSEKVSQELGVLQEF